MGIDPRDLARAGLIGVCTCVVGEPVCDHCTRLARRRAGRKARAQGESAEAQVLVTGAWYESRGRARVWKRPTPTRQVGPAGPKGMHRACYQAGAGCDFHALLDGGRMAVLEVKSAAGVSLPLQRRDRPVLTADQAEELETVDNLGGLALVLVRLRAGWWLLDWRGWRAASRLALQEGRKSLDAARLDRFGARCPIALGGPDWLAVLPSIEEVSRD